MDSFYEKLSPLLKRSIIFLCYDYIFFANELVIKSKTVISTQSKKTDILTLYGVLGMINQIIEKEKFNLFNNLCLIMESQNIDKGGKTFIVAVGSL